MEKLSHVEITTESEANQAYNDFHSQMNTNRANFIKAFQNERKTILQCDSNGNITLEHQPLPGSQLISETKTFEPTPQPKRSAKDQRRKFIDNVIEVVGVDIEKEKLSKLLQIVDFVEQNGDQTPLSELLKLKENEA